jgi:hypothetical protein
VIGAVQLCYKRADILCSDFKLAHTDGSMRWVLLLVPYIARTICDYLAVTVSKDCSCCLGGGMTSRALLGVVL